MERLDEQILNLRNEENRKNLSSLQDGTYIKNELVKFHKVEVENKNLTMYIPQDFVTLSPEIAKIKYPSEQRPQWIKTSSNTSVNICVSLLDTPLDERILETEMNGFKNVIKNMNPAVTFIQSTIKQLEDFKIAWFDYKSFAVDNQIYNIMFFASIGNQMLHGVFNCLYDDYTEWKKSAIEMIESIKLKDK